MPVKDGAFYPDVCEKQVEIMRACRTRTGLKKYVLINGCRLCGKSIGCLHAIVEHAWNVANASVCVLCPSIPSGSSSGVWNELTEKIIPKWIEGDFGLEWALKETPTGKTGKKRYIPQQDGATKKLYCYITNKFGGKSRIELNSLKDERSVEDDYKNRYFTMIYWSEMSNYNKRETFDTLIHSLRSFGTSEDELLLLGDTNPNPIIGQDHWLYKLFYEFRVSNDVSEDEKDFQRSLKLIEATLDDNPYLTDQRKREIRASFAHDPNMFACYAEGRWVKASTKKALFADVFKRSIHVVEGGDILVPDPNCVELIWGWDFGSANPAAVMMEKCFSESKSGDGQEQCYFQFLDELCFLGVELWIGDFCELLLEKMAWWEKYLGRSIMWQHWSDRSAFDVREGFTNRFQYEEVYSVSGGKIRLDAVDRRPGSVGQRIRLWRKLLFQQRMFFSAEKCPKLTEMNSLIERGQAEYSITKNSPFKHPFDAGSYSISRECFDELQDNIVTLHTAGKHETKLISVNF